MAGRRTNLALLVCLSVAFASGVVAFGLGSGWNTWATVVHAVAGFAIVVLIPWKSVVARRGLARRRRGRWVSVALVALVCVAIVTGMLHAAGVVSLGLTAMQLHVGAALIAIPFALWHVVARPIRMHATDLSRRALMRAGLVAGGGALLYGATETLMKVAGIPGAHRRGTGSHETGSFDPDAMPVTQWLDDSVPVIDVDGWSLRVGDRELGYGELLVFEDRVRATIDCTGGWYAQQDWEGVRLARLLPIPPEARSIRVVSLTGYDRRFPVTDLNALVLATRVGGRPLDPGHGYPARLVAPQRRGFWWVKWVAEISADDVPWWWQPPFPVT